MSCAAAAAAGKSLLWVAVLGFIVFYLYALVSFALLRTSFDPENNLFCASLWQCTVTVIRYGLIGDIFDVRFIWLFCVVMFYKVFRFVLLATGVKLTIRPGFSTTVLYFRNVSWIQTCPGFVLDFILSDLSLENMPDVLVIQGPLQFFMCVLQY